MGWSRHHKIGLIHYNPQQSYRGYTLVATNRGGYHANLIDMEGPGLPPLVPPGGHYLRLSAAQRQPVLPQPDRPG